MKIQKSTNVLDIQVYNNKLNKIKDVAKKNYFKLQCNMNKDNLKTTWKLIGTILHNVTEETPAKLNQTKQTKNNNNNTKTKQKNLTNIRPP